ncbi:hypothetical protein JCM10212_004907 [Sporobolomyces blumeae]
MLARATRNRTLRPARPTPRSASTSALDRVLLDIHAAHHADQARAGEVAATVTKSDKAKRGESMRGDVALPRELQTAVNSIVDTMEDKTILRNSALDLYAHLRRTSAILPPPSSYRDKQALSVNYDDDTSLAYLAGLMPAVYAATLNVLKMTKDRIDLANRRHGGGGPGWEPDRLVEFGSGTGSAAWAFEDAFGVAKRDGSAREYVGLDASRTMVEVSSALFGALPLRRTDDGQVGTDATSARLAARSHQMTLPASTSALAKLHLSPNSSREKRTIALAAFALGDFPSREKRRDIVRAMWDSGAEVMVVVDRGTPAGSRIVIEAREQLLRLGQREVSRAVAESIDPDMAAEGLDVVVDPELAADVQVDPSLGSHVIAPCPHDMSCPLHQVTKTFCHFSQRVQTPSFLRLTKHSTRGEDDAKFSYVVVRRGQRPASSSSFAKLVEELDLSSSTDNRKGTGTQADGEGGKEAKEDEMEWPRMIAPPLKRSGHVILEVCAASGEIERHTIPKSQGRQEYYDARKSAWGDSFPHAPKNGPQPSPSTSSTVATVEDEVGKPRNKFGGSVKARSTKAQREGGKREARELRDVEVGRVRRRDKREDARLSKTGLSGRALGGASGDGVTEFEVCLGDDGEFHVRR